MREFLKRAKADYLLSSVLCIVLGIIFVVWKGGVIDVIGTILSVAMIIVGIIYLGSFILSLATFGASTIVGILVLAVGIWFLIQPSLIVSLVPVILGVGLVFHGIRAVTEAVNAKKYGYEKWGMDLVFAIICLITVTFIFHKLCINSLCAPSVIPRCTRCCDSNPQIQRSVDTEFVENEGDRDETDGI